MGGVPATLGGGVNRRLQIVVGTIAVVMFVGLGALMLSEERTGLGAVFLAVGVFRGGWLARQLIGGEEQPG